LRRSDTLPPAREYRGGAGAPKPAGGARASRYRPAALDPEVGVADEESEERGKLDTVSLLYIAGGIPAMVLFFIVLFTITRHCGTPA
jgi:hypothetical protein